MFKNYLTIFVILFLTSCSAPGTALLGPALTGAKTGSLAQASLSFGTNQIANKINDASQKSKKEIKKIVVRFDDFTKKLNSKEFYASVEKLYLKDQKNKKEHLFHR